MVGERKNIESHMRSKWDYFKSFTTSIDRGSSVSPPKLVHYSMYQDKFGSSLAPGSAIITHHCRVGYPLFITLYLTL